MGFWSGKQDLNGALPLSSEACGIRESSDSDEFYEEWLRVVILGHFLWIEPKVELGWGMFPCPGLRSCLCFPALPLMVSVFEEVLCCSLRAKGFCAGLWSIQRFTREGVGGQGTLRRGRGRGVLCSGYRPSQPGEMPLGRGVKEASRHLKSCLQASQS